MLILHIARGSARGRWVKPNKQNMGCVNIIEISLRPDCFSFVWGQETPPPSQEVSASGLQDYSYIPFWCGLHYKLRSNTEGWAYKLLPPRWLNLHCRYSVAEAYWHAWLLLWHTTRPTVSTQCFSQLPTLSIPLNPTALLHSAISLYMSLMMLLVMPELKCLLKTNKFTIIIASICICIYLHVYIIYWKLFPCCVPSVQCMKYQSRVARLHIAAYWIDMISTALIIFKINKRLHGDTETQD